MNISQLLRDKRANIRCLQTQLEHESSADSCIFLKNRINKLIDEIFRLEDFKKCLIEYQEDLKNTSEEFGFDIPFWLK